MTLSIFWGGSLKILNKAFSIRKCRYLGKLGITENTGKENPSEIRGIWK